MIVAPLAGAWIETWWQRRIKEGAKSHPSRVRGLKRRVKKEKKMEEKSHPSRVRGLKPLPCPG